MTKLAPVTLIGIAMALGYGAIGLISWAATINFQATLVTILAAGWFQAAVIIVRVVLPPKAKDPQ